MRHWLKLFVVLSVVGIALAAFPGRVDAQSGCSWEVFDTGEVECEFSGSAGDTFEVQCVGCVGPLEVYDSSGRLLTSVDWIEEFTLSTSGKHTVVGEYVFIGDYQEVCRDNPSYSAGCNQFGECGSVGGDPTICDLEYISGRGEVSIYVRQVSSAGSGGDDVEADEAVSTPRSSSNDTIVVVPPSDGNQDEDTTLGMFSTGIGALVCCLPVSCLGVLGLGGGIYFATRKKKTESDEPSESPDD